jgi:hypothetical protein
VPRQEVLRRINRTVREYLFLPVDGAWLDEPMRGHFATLTPPVLRLGFRTIGDFQMKPEPVVTNSRLFLSRDGRTLASIHCVLRAGTVSFISVLADGTCVHTLAANNPHPERTLVPEDQLVLVYLPRAHSRTLHRRHQEAVTTATVATGAEALTLQDEQYRALMIYDQRLFNRWRYRHGGLDREPPAPDFRTLQAPVNRAEEA